MADDIERFRVEVRSAAQSVYSALFREYVDGVMVDGNNEDRRKALVELREILGLSAEKRQDPNAGLAVFNIVIGSGGVQAVDVTQDGQGKAVVEVAAREVREVLPALEARVAQDEGDDHEDLLRTLDDMLDDR